MKKYLELKNLISYHAMSVVRYKDCVEISHEEQELLVTLSQSYLQFLPVISLSKQYENTVKDVFLIAYNDTHIEDIDDYCGVALSGIYARYYGYISDAYKEAILALKLATEALIMCESCYHQAKANSNVFAEDFAKLLSWRYLITGDVSPESDVVYDIHNGLTITEFAKQHGFYPTPNR